MDLEYSPERVASLVARRDTLDGDIASLRKALTKLERERKATKLEIDEQLKASKAEHHKVFIQNFYTKLPRELRDRIYQYLSNESAINTFVNVSDWDHCHPKVLDKEDEDDIWNAEVCHKKYGREREYERWTSRSFIANKTDKRRLKPRVHKEARIFDDIEHAGAGVARETACSYYADNVFKVIPYNPARAVYRLFTIDRLPIKYPGLSRACNRHRARLVRPHDSIRRVDIVLHLVDFEHKTAPEPGIAKRKLNYLHTKFRSAFDLVEDKNRLHIQFFLTSRRKSRIWCQWSEKSILNMLEALKTTVYDIIHGGGKVTLKIHDDKAGYSPDLITLFHLTPAEWQKEQEDHIQRWGTYAPENNYIIDVKEDRRDAELQFAHGGETYSLEELYDSVIPRSRKRWGYEYFLPLLTGASADADTMDYTYQK